MREVIAKIIRERFDCGSLYPNRENEIESYSLAVADQILTALEAQCTGKVLSKEDKNE